MTLEVKNQEAVMVSDASPKSWGLTPGIINKRYFSPTRRMEQGTEEVDKQQKGDGSHIL
ncbi:MAG: hypothetical protein EZS28_046987, partial [Streblomastix strix]